MDGFRGVNKKNKNKKAAPSIHESSRSNGSNISRGQASQASLSRCPNLLNWLFGAEE